MQAIPGQLIKLRVLSQVPVSEYSDIAVPDNPISEKARLSFFKKLRNSQTKERKQKVTGAKTIEMNSAAWINFAKPSSNPISLWLSFEDDKGERSVLIDEQELSQSLSIMLSGSAKIKTYGLIKRINICCGGLKPNDLIQVDEAYARRILPTTNVSTQLAS